MRTYLKAVAVAFGAVLAVGCGQPAQPGVVRGYNFNGYFIDYELAAPVNVQMDVNSLSITTGKTEIRICDGKLPCRRTVLRRCQTPGSYSNCGRDGYSYRGRTHAGFLKNP